MTARGVVRKDMNAETNFVMVSTTVDNEADAQSLAAKLVEARLAACVQYTPIRSVYRWKGVVESTEEYLLLAKTRDSLVDELMGFLRDIHAYETPEIMVTPVIGGSKKYLDWLKAETRT